MFARRNVEHIRQIPEKLLDVTLQPLMFVLLFAYVFGGAIVVEGGNYREYLIGGILVQTLAFGMIGPAMSIATDLTEGVIDRFRSLPGGPLGVPARALPRRARRHGCWRSAILLAAGFVVGWRTHTDLVDLGQRDRPARPAFAAAMIWVGTWRRPARAVAGRGDGRRPSPRLPADVHQQRLRADRVDAQRPAVGRRVEPGQRDRRGRPRRCSATR